MKGPPEPSVFLEIWMPLLLPMTYKAHKEVRTFFFCLLKFYFIFHEWHALTYVVAILNWLHLLWFWFIYRCLTYPLLTSVSAPPIMNTKLTRMLFSLAICFLVFHAMMYIYLAALWFVFMLFSMFFTTIKGYDNLILFVQNMQYDMMCRLE